MGYSNKPKFSSITNKKPDVIESIILGSELHTHASDTLYAKDFHPKKMIARLTCVNQNCTCKITKMKAEKAIELLKKLPLNTPANHTERARIYNEVKDFTVTPSLMSA